MLQEHEVTGRQAQNMKDGSSLHSHLIVDGFA